MKELLVLSQSFRVPIFLKFNFLKEPPSNIRRTESIQTPTHDPLMHSMRLYEAVELYEVPVVALQAFVVQPFVVPGQENDENQEKIFEEQILDENLI